jgi:hypothetical protein
MKYISEVTDRKFDLVPAWTSNKKVHPPTLQLFSKPGLTTGHARKPVLSSKAL